MRPNVGKAILGGLAGTLAMTLMMYFVSPRMGVKMDIAASLGKMLGGSWALGMMMHFINGTIIFPLIYAFLLYRVLPGQAWAKGVYWGLILWFLAQVVVMPMMGGGFFSANMGGMKAVIGSLLGHIVYGGLLGWIAGSAAGRGAVQQFPEGRAPPERRIIKEHNDMTISASVPLSPQDVCPVLTGTSIPAVTLRTADGEIFDLNEAVKQQPSVLVFYRGGW